MKKYSKYQKGELFCILSGRETNSQEKKILVKINTEVHSLVPKKRFTLVPVGGWRKND
jgi:hypothetical protein